MINNTMEITVLPVVCLLIISKMQLQMEIKATDEELFVDFGSKTCIGGAI